MATMRLRCIHSCMVLTVVGLLLIYSAFLTSPSFVDSTLDAGGETTGPPNANNLLLQPSGKLVISNAITDNNEVSSGGDGVGGPAAAGPGGSFSSAISLTDTLPQANLRVSQPLTASSVLPDSSSQDKGDIGQQIAVALLGKQQPGESSVVPTLTQHIHDIVLKKKLESQQRARAGRNVVWTRDIYEPGFSYPNPQVCPNDGLDIRLIILITSAPGHFSARDAIRLTWGHYAQRLDVSMAFIIGKTENDTILDGIETEKRLYDDLIVANFVDSYDNLTLKTMSSLEWIDTYCNQSEFVLKTDDDMFINVPNLLKFIDRVEAEDKKRPKLYGRLARKWKPVRNKRSKYYISFQQYKKTVYPDFNTGPAYLFSTRIVRPLFEKGMEKTYLKLEDVYTTGIVAEELGVKRINIADFANKKVNFHKTGFCALSKLISMHMVAYHEQFELWKKILDGRTKCKIIYTSAKNTKDTSATSNTNSNSNSNSNSHNSDNHSTSSSTSNNNSNSNNSNNSSSNNNTSATVTIGSSSGSSSLSSNSPLHSSSSSAVMTSSAAGAVVTDQSDQPKK